MSVFINPGSGPVADSSEDEAWANIRIFAAEAATAQGVNLPAIERDPSLDDGDGRISFRLRFDGHSVEVQMPGLPLDRVRWIDGPEQNIWNFPRLYVDGSSWVWLYAVDACEPDKDESA